jgi:mutator protein MutT
MSWFSSIEGRSAKAMDKKPLSVAAAVIFRDGKYLITQRMANDSFGGCWEIPGGKQEPNETLQEAVVREIREELGVEIEVVGFYRTAHYPYPTRSVDLHLFHCRMVSGEPEALECQAFAWAKPEELKAYRFPDADATLIGELSKKTDWPA